MPTQPSTPRAIDEGRFRLAMASSGIGMAIVGLDGRWLDVNPAFERMFGRTAADVVGRSTTELTHPDDRTASQGWFAALASGESEMLDAEKRYLHRDGSALWVHLNVAGMRDAQGQVAYLIAQLRDITAQREAEQALQALNATLEQRVAERTAELQAVNRQQELFAYGVSHDLRAPLRAIDNFAALLDAQEGAVLDDVARDYLGRVRGAATRMGALLDALLDHSRASRSELKPQPVDLSLLAEWVGAELADAEPDRAHRIGVQPGLAVQGDERLLKLLLNQLLHNAWKFSRDRDHVHIDVRGERTGDRLVVTIRDQGIGFDMQYADKLFQPFQRLHGPEQAAGSGMGLTIAQRIVERHGGRLWAQSQPDAGATFFLELPAVPDTGPGA